MSEVLRNLNENLKRQTNVYSELNRLAELKQRALIKNNLHELEMVTAQEEQLLLEGGRLEKERLLWAEQIGREMGKAPEELTLAELAERYPELESVRKDLDDVLSRLQEAHEINTELLEQAVKIVNVTLNMLTQEDKRTYSRPGKEVKGGSKQARILDKSV
ncbi:flagellar protein FlgN [Paradesulfitobacterium ferrireducens]|uniref:flagellar protein FlgN n=1 Tax=Paradesulfitobacterium ferrireducens TaxID=2816476 RepID=UPI001A90708C|nr:flagellar protein FlgN [Paradesulfitobacterium ferrireducens]